MNRIINIKLGAIIGLLAVILLATFLIIVKIVNPFPALLFVSFSIIAGGVSIGIYVQIFRKSRKKNIAKNLKDKTYLRELKKSEKNEIICLAIIQKKYSAIMALLALWIFIIACLLVYFEPDDLALKLIIISLFLVPSIYCYKKRLEIFRYKCELGARGLLPFPRYLPEFKYGMLITIAGIITGLGIMFSLIGSVINGTLEPSIMIIFAFFLFEYVFIVSYFINRSVQRKIEKLG